jgi:CDP-paratose 2-epimerase
MNILITGGAGFVGSTLARQFKNKYPAASITAFDNLKRRGSELNLSEFRKLGISFVHGDVRSADDLEQIEGKPDLFIDASAEPSVHAGMDGSPAYLLQTNLNGTLNCLEFVRRRGGRFMFLSTSRIYSIRPLQDLLLIESNSRFEISADQNLPGVGERGIAEEFPTNLSRSLYGATKLASELFVQEYSALYGIPALINRCGVIAGPGQFGRTDQGVFTYWVTSHLFGRPLCYTGFGGTGKQVRDLLHPEDLFDLLIRQLGSSLPWNGSVYNVGGGRDISVSMLELTAICRRATSREVPLSSIAETSPVDIPLYVTDYSKVQADFGWTPRKGVDDIVNETACWAEKNRELLIGIC